MLNGFSTINGNKTYNYVIGFKCHFVELTKNLTDCDWGSHGKHGTVQEGHRGGFVKIRGRLDQNLHLADF